jgi:hypothetical protein
MLDACRPAQRAARNIVSLQPLSRMPSTAIRDHDYDAGTERLTITFVTGRIYVYEDVPPNVAADFGSASSRGRFFNETIRDRYRYREIAPTHE